MHQTKGNISFRTSSGILMPVAFIWSRDKDCYTAIVDGKAIETIYHDPTPADYVRFFNMSSEAARPGKAVRLKEDVD